MASKPVLLIGGYGVAGERVARLLRHRHPDLPLAIGGRTLEKGQALAAELGGAQAVRIDLDDRALGLSGADFSAIGVFAKDETLNSMDFAGRHGIPHVSISSAAFEIGPDIVHGLRAARKAAIAIAHHWFSGAATVPALLLAERFDTVDTIEIGLVIDRGGAPSGPATTADFQRITSSCPSTLVRRDGHYVWVTGADAKSRFRRADGVEIEGSVAVSNDVLSLGAVTGAKTIRVLEAFGVSASSQSGGQPCDEIVIRISGRGKDGAPLKVEQSIAGSRITGPLTAISCVIILERLTGIAGGAPLPPGLYMAEDVASPAYWVERMKAAGVTFSGA